ncbi:MAG TPA: aquaporin [Methylomirabilota bacterium]|nr:aquaporin [Methylomirabilota bacterium]
MAQPINKYIAEALGAFALVFAGAGAAAVNAIRSDSISHVGVALVFGLIVLVVIYTIGDVSGAHINPAVTLGFAAAGRFPKSEVMPYITAQSIGAITGAFALRFILGPGASFGMTLPWLTSGSAFLMEALLTCFLMFVILNVSSGAKEKGITAGIVIGSVIALEALMAGPLTGASMNPARSLGPALAALDLRALWIYLFAPPVGAWAAVYLYKAVRPDLDAPPSAPSALAEDLKRVWNS